MPVESASDLASFFEDDEFAEAAVYRSPVPGTDPVPCLVIMDRGQGRGMFARGEPDAATSERHLWAMAGDEENQLPDIRRGGTFTVDLDGEVLRVAAMPQLDHVKHVWSVQLVAVD